MGLFDLIPKLKGLPPELLQLLSNPGELGKQVKAFYSAATGLLAAIDVQRQIAATDPWTDEAGDKLAEADAAVYVAADAFRAELNKLPPLDSVTQ